MTNIISHKHLRSWKPCEDGYKRFCKLFPEGADLETAINGLVKDGREDWGFWLFERCRENNLYPEIISKGYRNSGDWNSGDWNSGNRNSGDWNSGDWNSGDWNSGNRNSGHFNTITPDEILIFNKPCKRTIWDAAYKPSFMFFSLTYWVDEKDMTDEEKAADPNFYVRGGQLRTRDYKEAWGLAWEGASQEDRDAVKKLPNFDADIFFEITGIREG